MAAGIILALMIVGANDDRTVDELIAQLSSASSTQRAAASAALLEKGRAAVPALRAASRTIVDGESRDVAAGLLADIEQNAMNEPTLVTLNVQNQIAGEAFKQLADRNHFEFTAVPDNDVRQNMLRSDDRGHSLIAEFDRNETLTSSFSFLPESCFALQIKLKAPMHGGGTVKRLRGAVSVVVLDRMPDPITVPLAGSQGKSFDGPDATLVLRTVELNPRGQSRIEVEIRSKIGDLGIKWRSLAQTSPRNLTKLVDSASDHLLLVRRLDLLDESNNTLPDGTPGVSGDSADEATVSFYLSPRSHGAGEELATPMPAKLRFYSIIRGTTTIPFEFRDIPVP